MDYLNVIALLNENITERNILDMLHHLAVHIVVVVLAVVRHCKGYLLFSILSVIFIFIFPISQIVTLNITIFNSIQR